MFPIAVLIRLQNLFKLPTDSTGGEQGGVRVRKEARGIGNHLANVKSLSC